MYDTGIVSFTQTPVIFTDVERIFKVYDDCTSIGTTTVSSKGVRVVFEFSA
jgi:hypothetical protein